MSKLTTSGVAFALAATLSASPVHADGYDDAGGGRRFLYGAGAFAANVIPGVSVWASDRCLPGYVVCKLQFAGLGTLGALAQLFWGGDVDGAQTTLARAYGGDWVVTPRQLATGNGADPYPEVEQDEDEDFMPSF